MKKLLMLNGPNLNLLGERSPDTYGSTSLTEVENEVYDFLRENGWELTCRQSNHEGELIDILHDARKHFEGVIFNPGGYSHTSVAIRDAIEAISIPVIEVHISNIYQREAFRHQSFISPVASGHISGLGIKGYKVAAFALLEKLTEREN
ncbi:type II 3-dehydroquinate dehydratase [Halalkalibacillus sediminis]|uniref:3-dehydroquinate dehydratase n=1 Tax=Halalkalibacillus sediminis TaxID=2018042 RepID=A0A2I0QXY6_9BACI|nr:type II 3-dehydroquinate dehydratase [Halalkalibacillus sediminis]PKR78970.1 type II 3-dehydroquinate dehydratase [Halalkalibacillus sediminis]